jgi:hypothetical protein
MIPFALAFGLASWAAPGVSWLHAPPKSHQLVYLTVPSGIDIYDATAHEQFPVGQIIPPNDGGGGEMYVDDDEDLYLSDGGILGYHRGALLPFVHYVDPNMYVGAICGTGTGTLFAIDGPTKGYAPADTVEIYQPGHRRPIQTLYDANASGDLQNCAADSSGDLFVSYSMYFRGVGIDEFPAGSTNPVILQTFATGTVDYLALDAERNLLVSQWNNGRSAPFQVFAPPYNGAPIRTFGESQGSLAFDGSGKKLWTVGFEDAVEFDYASGHEKWYTAEVGSGDYFLLAVSPQLTP